MAGTPGDGAERADLVDLYVRASASFGMQLQLVTDDEWDLPTPCPDWDIRALVAHVVLGDAQLTELVAGRTTELAQVDANVVGRDPMATWRGTALAAFDAARAMDPDTVVEHPVGPVPFGRVLGFRITENLVHAWDLATARSVTHLLDDEVAAWALDFWQPMASGLADSGHFGTMKTPADDTAAARLMALLGR